MADDIGIIKVSVEAESNKKKSEQAGKDTVESVKKGIGGNGHIEVPVDINVAIDKDNKKLTKAQNAIIKEINKMTSEGFSASGKDIVDLNRKFQQFKSEFKDAGFIQKYSEVFQQIKKNVDQIENRFKNLNGFSQKSLNDGLKLWEKEYKNKIKKLGEKKANELADKAFFRSLEADKSGRKAFAYRTSNSDDTYFGYEETNPKTGKKNKPILKANDRFGTYFGNNALMKSWARAQKDPELRKKIKESLKTYTISGYADKQSIERILGKRSNTNEYKNTISKEQLYAENALKGGQAMGKTPDVTVSDLAETAAKTIITEIAQTDFQSILPAFKKAVNGISAEYMNRFKVGGYLGVNYGEEGEVKGVGVNYERWQNIIKEIFQGFDKIDFASIQEAFDKTRDQLTNAVSGFAKQQKAIDSNIRKLEKQIQENVKVIGQENYSRESIIKKLNRAKENTDKLQSELDKLTSEKEKIKASMSNQKADYDKGEKEYRSSYNATKKALEELEKEIKTKKIDSKPSSEYTDSDRKLLEKRNQLQQNIYDNPYLKLIEPYNTSKEEGIKVSTEIDTVTKSLQLATDKVKEYEQQLNSLEKETKKETKARQKHVEQLQKENVEMKATIKELQFRKDEIKNEEEQARKNIFNAENYGNVEGAIRNSLTPLINDSAAKITGVVDNNTSYDRIESARESAADSAEAQKNQKIIEGVESDLGTGFNTDAKADQVIDSLNVIKTFLTNKTINNEENNCENILIGISTSLQSILDIANTIQTNGIITKGKKTDKTKSEVQEAITTALSPIVKENYLYKNQLGEDAYGRKVVYGGRERKTEAYDREIEDFRSTTTFGLNEEQEKVAYEKAVKRGLQKNSIDRSIVETTLKDYSKRLPELFSQKIMAKSSKEQDQMNADLIRRYGIGVGVNEKDTGDKARYARRRSLWFGSSEFEKVFKDFKLTPGIKIDTTEITSALAKVLSGAEMFKAQSGGWFNNLAIGITGGLAAIFQPSLEKTRAQADVVNTVMADMRDKFNTVIQEILDKESALSDMQEKGDITFNEDGSIFSATPEAQFTAVELEKSKEVLASLLADAGMIEEVVKETGGDLGEIVKKLGFTSPMLRKDNQLLANINAGLDKTGKALKFQRRSQEIINYAFQRLGRYIGQSLSKLLLFLNPLNLIKKAFKDFASYDVKWQRTMNVIKYNIRRIIKPFMEWIAQQLVNIIGLGNALVKGIGKIFGYDWDLFDQTAAATEKMNEELEAAANVSAGFDELHDIGSDNSAAGDLMGDIYTPQWTDLYKSIEDFGEKVADIIKTIKDTISGWDFWDWLAIGGAVVGGIVLFKWLIGLFSGKNPLQSVADGFKVLEELLGLAAVIWTISELTKALTDFFDVVGRMESEEIEKALWALAGALGVVGLVIAGLITVIGVLITTGYGAAAVFGLALIIGAIALVIYAIKDLTTVIAENSDEIILVIAAMGVTAQAIITTIGNTIEGIIQKIGDTISQIVDTIITGIQNTITTIGNTIVHIIQGIADAIMTVLQPIMDFIDDIISKIVELATTIVHEIGETIRSVVETIGKTVVEIIDTLVNAIPRLLDAILRFIREVGPAIENSADAIMRTITKLINFTISGIEYLVNTLVIDAINSGIAKLTFGAFPQVFDHVAIARFVPKYEKGTNYVPNDGLAYLHQGEAVVPKKYNQPYNQGLTNEERAYMQQMMLTMKSLDSTMKQGIPVNGEFVQRGSDLVAVVNKTNSQTGANLLSNVSYAR